MLLRACSFLQDFDSVLSSLYLGTTLVGYGFVLELLIETKFKGSKQVHQEKYTEPL